MRVISLIHGDRELSSFDTSGWEYGTTNVGSTVDQVSASVEICLINDLFSSIWLQVVKESIVNDCSIFHPCNDWSTERSVLVNEVQHCDSLCLNTKNSCDALHLSIRCSVSNPESIIDDCSKMLCDARLRNNLRFIVCDGFQDLIFKLNCRLLEPFYWGVI